MEKNEDIKWMTIEEAADYLRCSLRYLREKAANREIPFTQFGGKALFHKSRIDEWMFSKEEVVKEAKVVESGSVDIDTNVQKNCNREEIDRLIQELIDFDEHFITGLGNNLKADLHNHDYGKLSEKIYAQLSRWCHPNRNSKREQKAQPIAQQISTELFGCVIPRTKHPSYRG